MAKHIHIHVGGKKTRDAKNIKSVNSLIENVKIRASRLKKLDDNSNDYDENNLHKALKSIIEECQAAQNNI